MVRAVLLQADGRTLPRYVGTGPIYFSSFVYYFIDRLKAREYNTY